MEMSSARLWHIVFLTCSFAVLLGNTNAAQVSGTVEDRFRRYFAIDFKQLSALEKTDPELYHFFLKKFDSWESNEKLNIE